MPAGLPLREHERAVRPPQCLEFGERDVLWREPRSLKSIVGIEKDQIDVSRRRDQFLAPLPSRREPPRNLGPVENGVWQQAAALDRRHPARLAALRENSAQRVEDFGCKMPELVRAPEVVEA